MLPELLALRGVEQSAYHHLDVHEHTMAALDYTVALERDPAVVLGDPTVGAGESSISAFLAEPVADELTRAELLRWGALLHDIAKPQTRQVSEQGRITFFGHDVQGAVVAREILSRLRASEKTCAHVSALTRHHLALGFLVHRQPISKRDLYEYLAARDPVAADVTLLSVADRLATRGKHGERAIAAHLKLAREIWPAALAFGRARPRPPVRGDVLAEALDQTPGPWLAPVIEELTAATYAAEIDSESDAIAHARAWLASRR
jgi:putative nucleotidyltransferase with HDIG domain